MLNAVEDENPYMWNILDMRSHGMEATVVQFVCVEKTGQSCLKAFERVWQKTIEY